MPGGPRDVVGLDTFLSMEVKMPIASLLKGNLTLWHDLSNWMNGHLDSMTEAHEGKLDQRGIELKRGYANGAYQQVRPIFRE